MGDMRKLKVGAKVLVIPSSIPAARAVGAVTRVLGNGLDVEWTHDDGHKRYARFAFSGKEVGQPRLYRIRVADEEDMAMAMEAKRQARMALLRKLDEMRAAVPRMRDEDVEALLLKLGVEVPRG